MMAQLIAPTQWRDTVIRDWPHLCEQIFRYRKDGHWIFRGMGDKDLPLIPAIGRPGNRKLVSTGALLPYYKKGEELMIEYFIRSAPPYLKHTPKSKLEWLAVAQHHGMFTRLLDWTESLLVAAFFAAKHATGKSTPAIYAVKDVPIANRKFHNKLDRLQDVALYYPPHISANIPAQRSVFTVHKHPDKPYRPRTIERLLLSWSTTGTAPITYRLNLDACGINMASLFPDINGLASYVSWIYKWGRLPPAL